MAVPSDHSHRHHHRGVWLLLLYLLNVRRAMEHPSQRVTDDEAALCRNVPSWAWYWEAMYLAGAFMLLSANFMNWVGYTNRLATLIQMRLQYKASFKNIVEDDLKRANELESTHDRDDEDYDDDVEYSRVTSYSGPSATGNVGARSPESTGAYTSNHVELATHGMHKDSDFPTPLPDPEHDPVPQADDGAYTPNDDGNGTILSQATFPDTDSRAMSHKRHKKRTLSDKDYKNRRIARRKPDELRFYNLIRKQSLLTGVVSFSSLAFWGLQAIFDKGSIFLLVDILINTSCVYLSIAW
eukprot:CAMPEP_0197035462 /NCGR_PEP_ID=MMETSP1384-20130603/13255_1 /TAXON_ID=29189 /ORGANISM="Ammonia sp." /LENGTH=296 /DNA_ID=CAMNT_0042465529 /DNA_START=450 /DNA_END=1338 /DNA_ORIENTATION=-